MSGKKIRTFEITLAPWGEGKTVTVQADEYRFEDYPDAYVFSVADEAVFEIRKEHAAYITDKTVEPVIAYVNVLADPEFVPTLKTAIETGLVAAFGDTLTAEQRGAFHAAFVDAVDAAVAATEEEPDAEAV